MFCVDPVYVKEFLGHRKLDTTLLYIQLAEALFKETTDEFTVKVASKPEEIRGLLEVGFEYVCEKTACYTLENVNRERGKIPISVKKCL